MQTHEHEDSANGFLGVIPVATSSKNIVFIQRPLICGSELVFSLDMGYTNRTGCRIKEFQFTQDFESL